MRTTVRKFLPVALTAAFVSACADAPTSTAVGFAPSQPSAHLIPIATPEVEYLVLCKAGPVGTYTFNATATLPVLRNATTGAYDQSAATYSIVVSTGNTITVGGTTVPGACYTFTSGTHNHIALLGGTTSATVTVVETGIPAGIVFDRVVVYQNTAGTVTSSSSTTNSGSGVVGGTVSQPGSRGASITFYNVPAPPAEGCTPGYWKQEHHWGSWAPVPLNRTFAQAGMSFGYTGTLLAGLDANGGGVNALARHAAAAYLNSQNATVDYAYTTLQVQAIANGTGAYAGLSVEARKDLLAAANEAGCPLGRAELP